MGIDGAAGGWAAILYRPGDTEAMVPEEAQFSLFDDIRSLWARWGETAGLALIDIPIGLPTSQPSRACDTQARKLLGRPRSSSVFPPPARAAFEARRRGADHATASTRCYEALGRRIPIQAWNIMGKIDEVDCFLRGLDAGSSPPPGPLPVPGATLREAHPELLFWALNARKACAHNKKRLAGREERLRILGNHAPALEGQLRGWLAERPRAAAPDDIVDAAVCALVAAKYHHRLASLPDTPPPDAEGLPMEIVYPEL